MYAYASGGGGGGSSGGGGLLLYIRDQKAANTAGGTATSGSWQTRTLNTEVVDEIGSTLAANQFTLPAGTYDVSIRVPFYGTKQTQTRLRNITDSTTDVVGSSTYMTNTADGGGGDSWIIGHITIAATKTFEVQSQVNTTVATFGFGAASNFGEVEVYTQVWIRKIA